MTKNIISPADEMQYFFGYYDLQPYDNTGERHLAHRVRFSDRAPGIGDLAELGFVSGK